MICPKCNIEKPELEFGLDSSRKSGRYSYCKPCAIGHQKKIYERKQKGIQRRKYKINPETETLSKKGLKRCARCKEIKEFDEFSKNSRNRDGKSPHCRLCRSIEKAIQYDRNDRKRDTWLFEKYRINLEDYNTMLENQEGKCLICGRNSNHRLCVDHDHKSNKVRGLLCKPCNLTLGNMDEDPERLRKAAKYLEYNLRSG